MPVVCKCANCGATSAVQSGTEASVKCPLYCKYCSTPEKREKMARENAEINGENNEVEE